MIQSKLWDCNHLHQRRLSELRLHHSTICSTFLCWTIVLMLAFRMHTSTASYQIQRYFSASRTQKQSSCFCTFMSTLPPRDGGNSRNLWIPNRQADYTCWNWTRLHLIHPIVVPVQAMAWLSKSNSLHTRLMLVCASLKRMFCFLNPTPCGAEVTETGINPIRCIFQKGKAGS